MKYLVCVLMVPVSVALRVWVLSELWTWFIVPQFHILPIDIITALGISIIVSLLTVDSGTARAKNEWWKSCAMGVCIPLFALALGWIVLLFR